MQKGRVIIMTDEALDRDISYPERLVFHDDDELYQKILEAEEDIRCGRVMSYEEFEKKMTEKYGF